MGSALNAAEITCLGYRRNESSVVAPYMEDKSWGTTRKRKHKQIPFTKNIFKQQGWSSPRSSCRSQCATHKLRATRAKFHSRSSTHLPPEQCLSQRLLLSAYVHSSGKMTILVSAPSFCQIITRQLDHKRKFGIVFREIYFDSFNCPFYKIITFVI